MENHSWLRWIGLVVGIGNLALYCCFYFVARDRKLDEVLQENLNSLASFSALFVLSIALIEQVNPQMSAWGWAAFSVGVPVAIHALMVMVVTDWKMALVVYGLILVALFMWPGLPFLGASTLRYVGIGGGIPVSIRVKDYGRPGTVSAADEMTGCLVLMTGSDVLIRPTTQILDCKLHPLFMSGPSVTSIPTYSRIERYPRADILRVSKFSDSCGTVDGLPSC